VCRDSVQQVAVIEEYEGLLSIIAVGTDRFAISETQGIYFPSAFFTDKAPFKPTTELFK